MGQPASEVWAEIWGDISPRIDTVLKTGEATWDEALLLFLERSGFSEETYHTFSYSPLTDEAAASPGLLCVVTEETERVIARTAPGDTAGTGLRTGGLADRARGARSRWPRRIGANGRDLPFTLTYLFEEAGDAATARLRRPASQRGTRPPRRGSTSTDCCGPWPARRPFWNAGRRWFWIDLGAQFGALPTGGAWDCRRAGRWSCRSRSRGRTRPAGLFRRGDQPLPPARRGVSRFRRVWSPDSSRRRSRVRAGLRGGASRAEALAEIDRAKTIFFSNVSHEFRTPLTLMLSPVEEVLARPADDLATVDARALLDVAHRNALRLLKLVNSLLDFSRIEAGRVRGHLSSRPTSRRITADLASSFRSAIERARACARCVVPARCPQPVFVDRDMWEKIVLNLLSNAFKFTFAGEIAVDVAGDGGRCGGGAASCVTPAPVFPRPSCRACSSGSTASRARAAAPSRAAASGSRSCRNWSGCTAGHPRRERGGSRHRVHDRDPVRHRAPCDTDRIQAPRSARVERGSSAMRMSRRRCGGWHEDARRRHRRPRSRCGGHGGEVLEPPARTTARRRIVLADDNADMRAYVARPAGRVSRRGGGAGRAGRIAAIRAGVAPTSC